MFSNTMSDVINSLKGITLGDFLDILLVAFILYSFFRLIKDTKAYQMALGLGIVLLLFVITDIGKLYVSHQIIRGFANFFIIAVIILFQGEIRRFLTALGSQSFFRRRYSIRTTAEQFEDLYQAVDYLAAHKIGALIAFEKEVSLKSYADRGTPIDAVLTKDLLVSLFFPNSPLHDGAVILQENKIVAAGCLLPLPAQHTLGEHFKTRTRHLAALGLSQETDAAVIIVSEETGTISLAFEGNLERGLDKEQLKNRLQVHQG
ncbi:MAG: diadenylate cyclase CdaA [Candidatus Aminicenantaceae bacterium]